MHTSLHGRPIADIKPMVEDYMRAFGYDPIPSRRPSDPRSLAFLRRVPLSYPAWRETAESFFDSGAISQRLSQWVGEPVSAWPSVSCDNEIWVTIL